MSVTTVIELVRKKKGEANANLLADVLSDPEIRQYLLAINPADPNADGLRGVQAIGNHLSGQGKEDEADDGLRAVLQAMGFSIGFRSIAPERVPIRPKEDGLLDATDAIIATIEKYPVQMANVKLDTKRLRELTRSIRRGRKGVRAATRFLQSCLRNLAVWEQEAFTSTQDGYSLIRPVAKADEVLGDSLEDVEEYLYGSAQQGAKTRTENLHKMASMQTKAERRVRDSIFTEIVDLAEDLRRLQPKPADGDPQPLSDDRRRPR